MNWVVLNFGTLIKQGCASYRKKWQLNPWSFIYFMCENASLQKLDTHAAMIFQIWSYQKFELPGDTGYIDRLVQDCSNSIANALELLQSCTKPTIYCITQCSCQSWQQSDSKPTWCDNDSSYHMNDIINQTEYLTASGIVSFTDFTKKSIHKLMAS